ncbi:hypothetical protein [Streptomyces sp. NPDC005180]|uniref:hypothetical protein n=1 Tax=Streptomyces sp. NPDC005180 TaxID=3156868 RepID=UPI0033B86D3B
MNAVPARPRRARGLPVGVLAAGAARCHDPGRVARAAREASPGARVEVLPGVSHHALPFTAAAGIARLLAG